jgi:uncharacterized protein (DUF1501 family)
VRRRDFIAQAAITGLLLPYDRLWAARLPQPGPRLVVVFLRGAVDGLNVVIPHADPSYYEYRPTISVGRPGSDSGAVDLDGRFGLHPALGDLLPLWRNRELAFVHACGSPDPDRSHFAAQAYMETATPGVPGTTTGWMNRLSAALALDGSASTVALAQAAPLIVRGAAPVATFPTGRGAERPRPLDRDAVRDAFSRLYAGDPRLATTWHQAMASRAQLRDALSRDMAAAAQDAPDARGFADDARRGAAMLRADAGMRLMFFELSGWDTHVNQGAAQGQLAGRLAALGKGLLELRTGLGDLWRQTTVLVMSEFGRTAHENGNHGTDHGHGNVHWLLGGPVNGCQVYAADWQDMDDAALHEGRDLPVTTDFRELIALVSTRHMAAPGGALATVLPGFASHTAAVAGLLR